MGEILFYFNKCFMHGKADMLLQVSHLYKSFDGNDILQDISFHMNEKDKTALVGVNGCGKSTLLNMILGKSEPDRGEIIIKKDITTGYVAQNQGFDSENTILQEMQEAKKDVISLEDEIKELNEKIGTLKGSDLDQAVKKVSELHDRFDAMNGYSYRSEITGVLKGLGFSEDEFDRPISGLSGGEKTRMAIARMLVNSPDLIILDEPTNHLDMSSTAWLETFLANFNGAVLIVSHDRYFLDRIVNHVTEISGRHACSFEGNYSDFSAKKQQMLDTKMKEYLKQQADIEHQQKVIEKLKSFNREKSIKRAESREKALEKITPVERPEMQENKMSLKFSPSVTGGNDVLTVSGLSKAFGDHVLFDDVNFDIHRGERITIIGDNGTGKTTLLKIITGNTDADRGTVTLGTDISIGYYDQAQQVLDENKTIFDEIHDAYPDMNNTKIRNVLASFLFTNDDVFKQIKTLSGGEKGRVSLAKLMLSDSNFLILDEPTNHLDIDSKEILEHALVNFTGTVLIVSHDRYFINKVSTGILELKYRTLLKYLGNYDDYLEKKEAVQGAWLKSQKSIPGASHVKSEHGPSVSGMVSDQNNTGASGGQSNTVTKVKSGSSGENSPSPSSGSSSLSYKEEKERKNRKKRLENEIMKTEEEISVCEKKQEETQAFMNDPANGNDPAGLLKASKESDTLSSKIDELMEKWTTLTDELSELD